LTYKALEASEKSKPDEEAVEKQKLTRKPDEENEKNEDEQEMSDEDYQEEVFLIHTSITPPPNLDFSCLL